MSVKIEAPVVVKPETASKSAFTNPGIELEMIYGKDPIKEKNIHDNETIKLASFFVNDSNSFSEFFTTYSNIPTENATNPDIIKGFTDSLNRIATNAFANNAPARINKLLPTIGKFNL